MISQDLHDQMTQWRRHLHANPEFGFEEHKTSAFVAQKLREFGFDNIETGIGGTGVVASLTKGTSNRAIGFRADMDALRITEAGTPDYISQSPGVMHACGHDGHTAMLLGAAKHLIETGDFDGTIRFIFQPAEEWGQGMLAMLKDRLLDRFPIQEAYGIHNMPGIPVGQYATRPGPIMGAEDIFEIEINGSGGHASRPHTTNDALLAACSTVTALQNIVARRLDPSQLAVVSVTELLSDGTRNAIASNAKIKGDCRSFSPEVSQKIETAMREIATATAQSNGCTATLTYNREFIPTINDSDCTNHAVEAAQDLGATQTNIDPMGASEDFARLTTEIPGNFMFIGNGDSAVLHHAEYDFNDDALPFGANYFVALAQSRLPN